MKVPLMRKGTLHGHVTEVNGEKMEMDVHLDMTTGRLLETCRIEKQGDHYELIDKEYLCSNILCDNKVTKPKDYDGGWVLCKECEKK